MSATMEKIERTLADVAALLGVDLATLAKRAAPSVPRARTAAPDRPLAAVAGADSLAKGSAIDRVESNLAKAAASLATADAILGQRVGPAPVVRRRGGETPAEALERLDLIKASGAHVNAEVYDRARMAVDAGPALGGAEPQDGFTFLAGGRPPYVDRRAGAAAELAAARESGNAYRIVAAERAVNDAEWRHVRRPEAAKPLWPC